LNQPHLNGDNIQQLAVNKPWLRVFFLWEQFIWDDDGELLEMMMVHLHQKLGFGHLKTVGKGLEHLQVPALLLNSSD
jgi:hypothetical protein